jgi:hypothetical protein
VSKHERDCTYARIEAAHIAVPRVGLNLCDFSDYSKYSRDAACAMKTIRIIFLKIYRNNGTNLRK